MLTRSKKLLSPTAGVAFDVFLLCRVSLPQILLFNDKSHNRKNEAINNSTPCSYFEDTSERDIHISGKDT